MSQDGRMKKEQQLTKFYFYNWLVNCNNRTYQHINNQTYLDVVDYQNLVSDYTWAPIHSIQTISREWTLTSLEFMILEVSTFSENFLPMKQGSEHRKQRLDG